MIELRKREVALAYELVVEAGQLVGRVAETTELGSEGFGGEALVTGFFESFLRGESDRR